MLLRDRHLRSPAWVKLALIIAVLVGLWFRPPSINDSGSRPRGGFRVVADTLFKMSAGQTERAIATNHPL
jgi:hypothetical protein